MKHRTYPELVYYAVTDHVNRRLDIGGVYVYTTDGNVDYDHVSDVDMAESDEWWIARTKAILELEK